MGLRQWQRLRYHYRPHYLGNALVDKGRTRIIAEVPESRLQAAIAD